MSEIPARSSEPLIALTPGSDPGVPLRPTLTALRAAFGQDEANHGTERYRVGNDGLVWVPFEAVAFLTSKGGFVVAKSTTSPVREAESSASTPGRMPAGPPRVARGAGLVRLHHSNANGCSYKGCEYRGDESGNVLVPAEAAYELVSHGFVPVPEAAAQDTLRPARSARPRKG